MWWYWLFSREELAELYDEGPNGWGPGHLFERPFIPTWQPDLSTSMFWMVLFGTLFTLVRPLLVGRLLLPLGRERILRNNFGEGGVVKFCESGTRMVFYTLSTVFIAIVALDQDYILKPWRVWHLGEPPSASLQWLYYIEMGWYFHQTFAHVFLDKRKADFFVMLFHHALTLALLAISWQAGYYRCGLLVLLCHDPCDPFLELGKMFNYLHSPVFGVASFVGLIVTWVLLRLVYLPCFVFSTIVEGFWIIGVDAIGYSFFVVLLVALNSLHVYWFVLIVRVGLKVGRALANPEAARGFDLDAREKAHKKKQEQAAALKKQQAAKKQRS